MKTLYYSMKIRKSQTYVNTGFVRVELGDKIKMFGILTKDFFVAEEEQDEKIHYSYNQWNDEKRCFNENLCLDLDKERFELPQILKIHDLNGNTITLEICNRIEDPVKQEKCDYVIQKTIDVFGGES